MIDRIKQAIEAGDRAKLYGIGMELGINCTEVQISLSEAVPEPLRRALDNGVADGRTLRQRFASAPYVVTRPADWRPFGMDVIKP